jgi:hypothetical protein
MGGGIVIFPGYKRIGLKERGLKPELGIKPEGIFSYAFIGRRLGRGLGLIFF